LVCCWRVGAGGWLASAAGQSIRYQWLLVVEPISK